MFYKSSFDQLMAGLHCPTYLYLILAYTVALYSICLPALALTFILHQLGSVVELVLLQLKVENVSYMDGCHPFSSFKWPKMMSPWDALF